MAISTARNCAARPLEAFFELPERVWLRPDIKPHTPEFQDEVFRRYGLFEADFDNDGLPLGLIRTTRDRLGTPSATVTCDLCHSSYLFGQLVEGQPNRFASMEQLFVDMSAVTLAKSTEPLFAKNPPRNTVVNAADHLGYIGLLVRQLDLAPDVPTMARVATNQSSQYQAQFDSIAYVKTPPWYLYRTKLAGTAGYYFDGGHPKTGNFAAFTYLSAFYEPDGSNLRQALSAWTEGGHAYLASLQPPPYPFAIDDTLARAGKLIYQDQCASCHGTYTHTSAGADSLIYPGLIVPIEEIDTDPLRAHFPGAFVNQIRRVLRAEYTPNRGYVATPLTAIWARAPYLHNGSVPTLRTLLAPATRPTRWALVADPNEVTDYLQQDVGWRYMALESHAPYAGARIHDPEVATGLNNGGHSFGAKLSAAQRTALIEFLKTL